MTHTVQKSEQTHEIAVGAQILPDMKRELETQNIEVVRVVSPGRLLRERPQDVDALLAEYDATFRNCQQNPGGLSLVCAKGEPSDMRMLARDLCSAMQPRKQRTPDEDKALLREVDLT